MSAIIRNRVKETTTTAGTGAITLAGAETGFVAFSSVCGVGDTCRVCVQAVDSDGAPTGEWEIGNYTYSGVNTLTRTTVEDSSNGGSAVNFSAGTKQVWIDLTADQIAGFGGGGDTLASEGALIDSAGTKATPDDADEFGYADSASLFVLVKTTWANIKTAIIASLGTVSTLNADTDGTLAANSDTRVATQKAVKTYVDTAVTGLLEFKGSTDCSGTPNYPAASKGDAYVVSVAGKIGGASGTSVDVGDVYAASADNAGGTQAAVGTSWFVLEHNLVGAMLAANNLSDLTSASAARSNLGLGTLATQSGTFSGTSSGTNTGDQASATDILEVQVFS